MIRTAFPSTIKPLPFCMTRMSCFYLHLSLQQRKQGLQSRLTHSLARNYFNQLKLIVQAPIICIRHVKDLVLAVMIESNSTGKLDFQTESVLVLRRNRVFLMLKKRPAGKAGKKIWDILSTHVIKHLLSIKGQARWLVPGCPNHPCQCMWYEGSSHGVCHLQEQWAL